MGFALDFGDTTTTTNYYWPVTFTLRNTNSDVTGGTTTFYPVPKAQPKQKYKHAFKTDWLREPPTPKLLGATYVKERHGYQQMYRLPCYRGTRTR